MKKVLTSLMFGIGVFIILFSFFNTKSFYPYNFKFNLNSKFSFIKSPELLQHMIIRIKSAQGDTVYIDGAEKTADGSLKYIGRIYSPQPVDLNTITALLNQELSNKAAAVVSANLCAIGIDLEQKDLNALLETILPKKEKCVENVRNQLKGNIDITNLETSDAGRMKKIAFVSLIISIFFAATIFVILEAKSASKK